MPMLRRTIREHDGGIRTNRMRKGCAMFRGRRYRWSVARRRL